MDLDVLTLICKYMEFILAWMRHFWDTGSVYNKDRKKKMKRLFEKVLAISK